MIGDGKEFDLEDLATADMNVCAFHGTGIVVVVLVALWIFFLIAAAEIKHDTWFLLTTGGIGILQNINVAGARRSLEAFGMLLGYVKMISESKVMIPY